MRAAGIYLLQIELTRCRMTSFPQTEVTFTLRLGRNSAAASIQNQKPPPDIPLNTLLQLNVQSGALETQRCSLTLTYPQGRDRKILGIALITIPKDKNSIENVYKMSQSDDKDAQIALKMRISPVSREISQLGKNAQLAVESTVEQSKNEKTGIKLLSKVSGEGQSAGGSQQKRLFKVIQKDVVVQTTEAALRALKDQKDTYYQLYQIEKAKNEVASKFIANLVKNIGDKFPSLIPTPSLKLMQSRTSVFNKETTAKKDQSGVAEQLNQANRSLHRQIEQYKGIIQSLRRQLAQSYQKNDGGGGQVQAKNYNPFQGTKANKESQLMGFLSMGPTTSIRQKASIVKQTRNILKHSPPKQQQNQNIKIDFKKWLEQSVGQREDIRHVLSELKISQPNEKMDALLNKLRTGMNKSFVNLMSKKTWTRETLMAHRKELNTLLEELST